jgi:hypothetical protein
LQHPLLDLKMDFRGADALGFINVAVGILSGIHNHPRTLERLRKPRDREASFSYRIFLG